MFNSFADHNELFTRVPSHVRYQLNGQINDTLYQIPVCTGKNCLPALFYDYYTDRSIKIEDTRELVFGTRSAWFKQNDKQNDLNFQNILDIKMYSVIPFCSKNTSKTVFRIFYSAGLKENENNLDITDFVDPTDTQYISSLSDKLPIIDRFNYGNDFVPCSIDAASVDDKVVGVSNFDYFKNLKNKKCIFIISLISDIKISLI